MRKTFFHDCAIISLNDTWRQNSDTGRELIASVLKSSRRINFNLNDQSIRFDNQERLITEFEVPYLLE